MKKQQNIIMLEKQLEYQLIAFHIFENCIDELFNFFDNNQDIPEEIRLQMNQIVQNAETKRQYEYRKYAISMKKFGYPF